MTKQRLTNLDVIKLFLAFIIIFHHFQQNFSLYMPLVNFYGGVYDWSRAVELFFMISGFLLARNDDTNEKLYIRPVVRRYIGFLFAAVPAGIACAVQACLIHQMTGNWMGDVVLDVPKIIRGLLLVDRGYIYSGLSINNPTWFCTILLYCDALFYFVKCLDMEFKKINKVYIYILITVFYAIFYKSSAITVIYVPFFNYDMNRGGAAFFIGCLLFHVFKLPKKKQWAVRAAFLALAAIMSLKYGLLSDKVSVFCVFPLLADAAVNTKQTDSKFISGTQGVSMYMYLWHIFFINLIIICITIGINVPLTPITMLVLAAVVFLFSLAWQKTYGKWAQKTVKKLFRN